jgi:hypothetical protein
MISPLYDEPAPQPQPVNPDAQTLGVMVSAALELARSDEDNPMPLDTSFDIHVDFAEREIEILWPCGCGKEDCTAAMGSAYGFDELIDLLRE